MHRKCYYALKAVTKKYRNEINKECIKSYINAFDGFELEVIRKNIVKVAKDSSFGSQVEEAGEVTNEELIHFEEERVK
ncbi:hypothetical protein SK128_015507 [Halocaridina rubra]|uniref:Uncharacterized protein n=1 Tax=Halocaridina rubra TaxID=373956 RepID=A0AAN8XK53_HALRR